jgi:hypothetical protein
MADKGTLRIDRVTLPDEKPDEVFFIKQIKVDTASAGDNLIVAGIAGRRIRLIAQSLSFAADQTISWKSDTGGGAIELISARTFKAGGGIDGNWGPHGYYCRTAVGKGLNIYLSSAVQTSGTINYIEE